MSRWLRWYAGTAEDGKFRFVARNAGVTVATVIGVWAALLEDASHDDHRGIVTRNEDFFAAILDLDDGVMEEILSAMESVELISVGHGAITIINWKERQFETDAKDPTNAERQRRYREKRKGNEAETQRNGTVTEGKRPDPDPDAEEKTSTLPSEQVAAREQSVAGLVLEGLGRGGVVSADARRKVAARLAIGNADPLVGLYENWPKSRKALDPDGLFISVAEKLYRDAKPDVRQACQPLNASPPEPIPKPCARPSSSLLASLNKGSRYGVRAH